ncbi:MAG: protein kinase domain-containing protein [Vicinamibacterales bacterium]
MAFEPGRRVGPYEVVAPLGAGGMGDVYRARDMRLDRTVAIKVLKGTLVADAESRQRFEQEARAIAALNDPHICTIHDVGRDGDLEYLVLEYLEGETLADRLSRAPDLAIRETIEIAIQIADALDHAHRAGIAHRDLKPGNVMLVRRAGPSGVPDVKLLDFGLAGRTAAVSPQADPSLDATTGVSLVATRPATSTVPSGFSGTIPYMAPEQLNGDPGDHRADIFSFGCVLYEMLAGRKAFDGATPLTVIAAITSTEPPPTTRLQPPQPILEHLMRRCLEKDRERRWQNMGDVAGELRWVRDRPGPVVAPPAKPSRVPWMVATAAVTIATALAIAAWTVRGRAAAVPQPPLRFELATSPTDDPSVALSPDGTQLAFVANQNHVPMIWLRSFDTIESRVLNGTEGASFPFWSPDGRAIGFFAADKLKRIDIGGGTPLAIVPASNARGGTWNADGVILFSAGVSAPIVRVSIRGGEVENVTEVNAGSGPAHRLPQFLPDGKRFLFTSALGTPETNGVYLGSLDKTPPARVLAGDVGGRFAPPDRLLTIRQGALQAYSFDPGSGKVQGEPVVVAQGFAGGSATSGIATSSTGVLAYRGGTLQRRQLVWVNRQGNIDRTIGEPTTDFLSAPELSADERSVVVFSQRTGDNEVWAIELARNLASRITQGPPTSGHPIWDPDGQHVVFTSRRFGGGPARQAVVGGQAEPLFPTGEKGQPLSWTRDRHYLLVRRANEKTGFDLAAVSTRGDRDILVSQLPGDETEGQFSPDGSWVAIVSNDGGQPEVFVQSFPEPKERKQVSTAGGTQVRWSADGKEVFYIAPDGTMMAVSLGFSGAALDPKLPTRMFQTHLATGTNVLGMKPQYAVSRDRRFLLNTAVETASAPIVVSLNWMKKPTR